MKVAFFLPNQGLQNIDFSKPEQGNPGTGATQYLFVALPYYLSTIYTNVGLQICLFAPHIDRLPSNLHVEQADTVLEAARKAKNAKYDLLVFRPTEKISLYQRLTEIGITAVAWHHNHPSAHMLQMIVNCPAVHLNIFVGYEQYHRIRDHQIAGSSTCIPNAVDTLVYPDTHQMNKDRIVAFMGSLIPPKGFHVLARAWPQILQKVPDAKLWVIGTGQLYSENAVMGKWSIADETYERQFRPYLSTEDGSIHPSVYFWGKLGSEKIELFEQIKVGVVNPTGKTECCPVSALEFQACGIPVVSVAKKGLLDTVAHNETGLLGCSYQELVENIVWLLRNNEAAQEMGYGARQFVKEGFNWQDICNQWYSEMRGILAGISPAYVPISGNWKHDYKWLRELNRVFKSITGLQQFPAVIEAADMLRSWRNQLSLRA